ncbi:hypothetical protein J5690_00210 [bacterium]|nr:hypothetical protein [bacterium]
MAPKKLKYVDFYKGFNPSNSFLHRIASSIGYETKLAEDPDYLICSVFGHEALDKKYDNCVKIFFTGENICPDFNLYDYAIGFEYLDFGDRYLRWPLYYAYGQELWNLLKLKHIDLQEKLAKKTEFCSFVYSNGNGSPVREQFFHQLSEYKKVNSGGRYLNNIGRPEGVKDKIEFESSHKFSIAFENSSHPGYTTEKLIQSFAAVTVPIYWGDPRIKEVFNSESFVFVNDYESLDAVVDMIKEIDQNDELYLKYLGTPALLEPEKFDIKTQAKYLGDFFRNILEQDKQNAFRRNRDYWGNFYIQAARSAFNRSLAERALCILRVEGLSGIFKRIKEKLIK